MSCLQSAAGEEVNKAAWEARPISDKVVHAPKLRLVGGYRNYVEDVAAVATVGDIAAVALVASIN